MATAERTAYPLSPSQLPAKELHRSYSLSDSEIERVNNIAKMSSSIDWPSATTLFSSVRGNYLRNSLVIAGSASAVPRYSNPRSLYKYQAAVPAGYAVRQQRRLEVTEQSHVTAL